MPGTFNIKFTIADHQHLLFAVSSSHPLFELGKGFFHDFDLCRSSSVLQASDNNAEILLDLKHL